MDEPVLLGLVLLSGLVAGFAFQRSRFCFVGSLRDLFLFGETGLARAALLLLGLTAAVGAIAVRLSHSPVEVLGPFPPALLLGGGLFGAGMVLAGSCASGAFWRLGEGQGSQLWILAGLLGGSWLWVAFPLGSRSEQQVALPPWVAPLVLLSGLVALLLWERRRNLVGEELPPLRKGPAWRAPWAPEAGAIVLAVSLGLFLALTGHTWRVTRLFLFDDLAAGLFALGLLGGGHIGARLGHEWRLRGAGELRTGLLRLTGGLLMGYGARMGWGCTIGALMGGMARGTAQVWLWFAGAVVGAWVGSLLLRRFMRASQ